MRRLYSFFLSFDRKRLSTHWSPSIYNIVGSMEMARAEGPNPEVLRAVERSSNNPKASREGMFPPHHQLGSLGSTAIKLLQWVDPVISNRFCPYKAGPSHIRLHNQFFLRTPWDQRLCDPKYTPCLKKRPTFGLL